MADWGGRFFQVFILTFVIYCTDVVPAMAFAQETVGWSQQFCLATCNARCCVMSRDLFSEWQVCYYQWLLMLSRFGWSPCTFILTPHF